MAWNDALVALHPITKVVSSSIIAEIVGSGLGQFGPVVIKNATPSLHEKLINTVSNNIMLPNIQDMEPIMEDMFQSTETKKDWDAAKAQGLEARSHFMAKHATDLALTFPASFTAAMVTKGALDKMAFKSNATTKDFFIGSLMEGSIHLGGILFLPRLLPEQMGHFKTFLSKSLQGMGMEKDTAETWSMNFTYSGLADIAGFSVNLGYMIWALNRGGKAK